MVRLFKIASFLLVMLIAKVGIAQNTSGKATIKGKVIDEKTNSVVEFATVSLYRLDSTLVTGAITSVDGTFQINNVEKGIYYLKTDFIGFASNYSDKINISQNKQEIDLGTIKLSSFSNDMEQFEFVDEKELFETKIDKKVYNVSKDIGSQGGTGLDALRNMPSVEVDDEDNISLRGDESVQVLIDGRPTSIPASQLLKQIPASTIERIEVVTNPSAKYNPEGMSGILNVILKKEKAVGINGNVGLGYTYNDNHGGNVFTGLNYRKNKLNIHGNVGGHMGTWSYNGVSNRNYFTDTTYTQKMTDFGSNDNRNLWYSGGVDYFVNDKNTIYVEANGWNGVGDRFDNNHYDYFDEGGVLQSYSDRPATTYNKFGGFDINTGWQAKFDSDRHTLDLDVDYEMNPNESRAKSEENFYLADGTEFMDPRAQNTISDNNNKELDAKLDYVLPINDSLEIEAGLRTTIENIDNDFYSASMTNGVFYPDTNLNNVFTYEQSVYAGYVTIGKQFNKIGVKAGARLENTIIDATLKNTNENNKQEYLSLFPSLHMSYKPKETGGEVQLSYSRRINRPNTWEVNPFTSFTDPYNLRTGNPNLRPEYIDVYELGYLKFWEKFNFNASTYFRQVNDKKQRVTNLTDDNVFVTMPENIGKTYITGGEATFGYKPYKWWRNNMTANLWSANLNSTTGTNFTKHTYGWRLQYTSNVTLNKGWSVQVRGQYSGKQTDAQGIRAARYSLNFSVSKSVLNKKGRITLNVNDVFNTRAWIFDSNNLGGFSYNTDRRWASQSIRLSFNYSFGKMNFDSQKRQTKNNSANDSLNISSGSGGQN